MEVGPRAILLLQISLSRIYLAPTPTRPGRILEFWKSHVKIINHKINFLFLCKIIPARMSIKTPLISDNKVYKMHLRMWIILAWKKQRVKWFVMNDMLHKMLKSVPKILEDTQPWAIKSRLGWSVWPYHNHLQITLKGSPCIATYQQGEISLVFWRTLFLQNF